MDIQYYPSPSLKKKCLTVDLSDAEKRASIKSILDQMNITMRSNGGLGLAANQVGLDQRLFVAWTPQGQSPRYFVNPEILKFPGEWTMLREGCLSIPGFVDQVRRCTAIDVAYLDVETGERKTETLTGYLAQVFQHELEHLNGQMFVDKLAKGKLDQLRAHMRKLKQSGRLNHQKNAVVSGS